jgi:hypothetical protein
LSNEYGRAGYPSALVEARAEIRDLDRATVGVANARYQHGCVIQVALLGALGVDQLDTEDTLLFRLGVAIEERTENRVTVEAWKTAPHDARCGIDQRTYPSVADEGELHGHTVNPAPRVAQVG